MKYITISREYGAGGRSVGLAVAKEFGLELYDRDIVREVAKESNLDYDYLEMNAEMLSKSEDFFRRITPMQYDQKDSLYDIQKDAILKYAEQGPCVVIGRCADAILEEAGYETFNVFLYASDIFRAIRAGELLETNDANLIQKTMKKIDAQRKNHYEHYTGKRWGDYHNYDLMIDTGKYGFENSAKLVIEAVKASE